MTKRRDILKTITRHARIRGQKLTIKEGANHTRIWIGDEYTTLPRHNDIPDSFAKKILKDLGIEE